MKGRINTYKVKVFDVSFFMNWRKYKWILWLFKVNLLYFWLLLLRWSWNSGSSHRIISQNFGLSQGLLFFLLNHSKQRVSMLLSSHHRLGLLLSYHSNWLRLGTFSQLLRICLFWWLNLRLSLRLRYFFQTTETAKGKSECICPRSLISLISHHSHQHHKDLPKVSP